MGLPAGHASPHAQVNALIAAPGPKSEPDPKAEQPPPAPGQASQVRTFFLLATGTEFDVRIDGTPGRRGESVNAILEADIRDTGTASRIVLPRATRLSGNYVGQDRGSGAPAGIVWKEATLPDGRRLHLSAKTSVEKRPGDDVSDPKDNAEPVTAGNAYLVSAWPPAAVASPSSGGVRGEIAPLLRPIPGGDAPQPFQAQERTRMIVRVRRDILLPAYGENDRGTDAAGAAAQRAEPGHP
jgi:hypothetical protein